MKNSDTPLITPLEEALLDAVITNNAFAVEKLLSEGANPNCYEDKCQIRPLHFAAVYNAPDTLFLLIKAGANLRAKTADGYTPLEIAKQLNHHQVVETLKALNTNLVSFA